MRITGIKTPAFDEKCEGDSVASLDGFETPPSDFTIADTEGRLIEELRENADLAAGGDILGSLQQAVLAQLDADEARANAFADLTVTGRSAYETFVAEPPSNDSLRDFVKSNNPALDDGPLDDAVRVVLDRAYQVLWNIVQPGGDRAEGWFAVCGEVDPPHRSLNVPSTGFAQYEITVPVEPKGAAKGHDVTTRFTIWDDDNRSETGDVAGGVERREPPEPSQPVFRDDGRYLLYVHGLGSSLEEPERLAKALRSSPYTIISMDLPNSGCAKLIDHLDVADTDNYMSLEDFPILDFVEQFVLDFVSTLSSNYQDGLATQIATVLGGSLALPPETFLRGTAELFAS